MSTDRLFSHGYYYTITARWCCDDSDCTASDMSADWDARRVWSGSRAYDFEKRPVSSDCDSPRRGSRQSARPISRTGWRESPIERLILTLGQWFRLGFFFYDRGKGVVKVGFFPFIDVVENLSGWLFLGGLDSYVEIFSSSTLKYLL